MGRVCIEMTSHNCSVCIDTEDCLKLRVLLEKLADKCKVDVEHVVAYDNGGLLSLDSDVCTGAVVKALRVVKGG